MADIGELVHLRSPLKQCKHIILECSDLSASANRGYKP